MDVFGGREMRQPFLVSASRGKMEYAVVPALLSIVAPERDCVHPFCTKNLRRPVDPVEMNPTDGLLCELPWKIRICRIPDDGPNDLDRFFHRQPRKSEKWEHSGLGAE